ncbi:hypothetical protein GOQ04_25235 [Emticicia sp. ODNR4P]|nr:hypothetical protein [Emticicia sp. ODNR4P]
MKYYFTIILLLLKAFGVDAQTIKGIVKDAKNTPITGASITQKGINNGTTTNPQGEFTLQLKATASSQIIVSFVGYSSKIVDTKGNTSLQIVLEEDNQQLNEVVVVGSRSAQNRTVTNSVVPVDLMVLGTFLWTKCFLLKLLTSNAQN